MNFISYLFVAVPKHPTKTSNLRKEKLNCAHSLEYSLSQCRRDNDSGFSCGSRSVQLSHSTYSQEAERDNTYAQLAFPFLYRLEPQPMGIASSTPIQDMFPPRLKLSGSSLIDMPGVCLPGDSE